MGTRLAFTATKNSSVEIAYITYKNLRYTPLKIFFSETLHDNLSGRSMKKTTSCKKATELPG